MDTSQVIGVWSETAQRVLHIHAPKLKCNLIASHTRFDEIPAEWLEDIEPYIVRPSWNSCWFIAPRWGGRVKKGETRRRDYRDVPRDYAKHPLLYVRAYEEGKGWFAKKVRARPYIARIFFEWDQDEPERYIAGFMRSNGQVVAFPNPRSVWQVKMTCGDDRCVNPSHFGFEPENSVLASERLRL